MRLAKRIRIRKIGRGEEHQEEGEEEDLWNIESPLGFILL
jgi:hypothetical protein